MKPAIIFADFITHPDSGIVVIGNSKRVEYIRNELLELCNLNRDLFIATKDKISMATNRNWGIYFIVGVQPELFVGFLRDYNKFYITGTIPISVVDQLIALYGRDNVVFMEEDHD